MGDSRTRGQGAYTQGAFVTRASVNSSISEATALALAFTASRRSYVAIFQTNQPVSSALRTVSFRRPSGYWLAANITMGGSKVRFCHWLYGAKFATPAGLMLESQPMGRGIVQLLNGLSGRLCRSVLGL